MPTREHVHKGHLIRAFPGERGVLLVAKKGELSKTARASLANRVVENRPTKHFCESCNEVIWSVDLYPVQVQVQGRKHMAFYHKEHYKVQ